MVSPKDYQVVVLRVLIIDSKVEIIAKKKVPKRYSRICSVNSKTSIPRNITKKLFIANTEKNRRIYTSPNFKLQFCFSLLRRSGRLGSCQLLLSMLALPSSCRTVRELIFRSLNNFLVSQDQFPKLR